MILLIDGTNLAFVTNAIGSMARKDGFPTRAIAGTLKSLRSYVTHFQPSKIFVAWDGGKSKKRMALHPGYKASRKLEEKTPEQRMDFEELLLQLPIIKQAVADLGLFTMEGPGIEGDDLIALLAKTSARSSHQAVIISSDSDFHQLVTENISVYSTVSKKTGRHVTYTNFAKIHNGLRPDQYLEFKALQGDKSDDIPGVKGIGEKTAAKLLNDFGTVDDWRLKVSMGEHKPTKTQSKIIDQWPDYQMSKAMIDLHSPLADFTTAELKYQEPNYGNVRKMALEFQISEIFMDFSTWVRPFKEM